MSPTVRPMGPMTEYPLTPSDVRGPSDIRPREGLSPSRPQQEAGIRTEPPSSVPSATGHMPLATAAADPPLEPPGDSVISHGLRHAPFNSDSVTESPPNSGVLVFPTRMKPAARRRRITAASSEGT